ncbi:Platelet-derived growth factor receptor beta [Merluccius polli]|uniref:Platelet-derived growth factor receptor beta n=1 Tax=Merluccius polli TaxID=89951 RepID=A0AA47N109_MERPO|nr:Platelet-derived growth factor receptor beta [Merluccius polli]
MTNGYDLRLCSVPSQIRDLTDHHLPGKRHLVTCLAEGVPAPTIQWYSCGSMLNCSNRTAVWQPLTQDPETLTIQTNVSYNSSRKVSQVRSQVTFREPQQVTVRCETTNQGGRDKRDVKLVSSTLFSEVAVLAAVLALVVIIIISIIILIAVWRKKPRYEIRWKVIESVSMDGHEYIYVDPIHLPYDLTWEMPRDNLVLGPLYLVTEYCRYGDLVDYLHRNKHSFLQYHAEKNSMDSGCRISQGSTPTSQRKGYVSFGSECDGGYMDMSKDEPSLYVPMQEQMDNIKYADIQPSPYESPYQQDLYQQQGGSSLDSTMVISDSPTLTHDDLLGFSYQVAKGMEFLASKNLFYSALKRGYRMNKPAHASDQVYDIMGKCWDEKFEKRPEFSFLVHTMGNMLTDCYKKRYNQVSDNFLKSEHPAVARTKPRISFPFASASPPFGPSSPAPSFSIPPDPYDPNPGPQGGGFRREADGQEDVLTLYNEYIIPIPDPKPEDVFGGAGVASSESPVGSLAPDKIEMDTAETLPEEDRLEEPGEKDALLGLSGTPDVEDSFL